VAGDIQGARETYTLVLTKLAPELVEAIVQAASFERRQDNLAAACRHFDSVIAQEEAREGMAPHSFQSPHFPSVTFTMNTSLVHSLRLYEPFLGEVRQGAGSKMLGKRHCRIFTAGWPFFGLDDVSGDV
jgi:hypothetical protein